MCSGGGGGLGRVGSVWSAAGVGEGAVFAGAVVSCFVGFDEFFADADLNGVGDDGDLDLAAFEPVPDPVGDPGE